MSLIGRARLAFHGKRFIGVLAVAGFDALLRRFPYGIYYRIYPDSIVIVACMHGRRDPKRWQSRA
jgi:plasmid stabilization system protein ParE